MAEDLKQMENKAKGVEKSAPKAKARSSTALTKPSYEVIGAYLNHQIGEIIENYEGTMAEYMVNNGYWREI